MNSLNTFPNMVLKMCVLINNVSTKKMMSCMAIHASSVFDFIKCTNSSLKNALKCSFKEVRKKVAGFTINCCVRINHKFDGLGDYQLFKFNSNSNRYIKVTAEIPKRLYYCPFIDPSI